MARYIDAEKLDFSPLKDDFDRARAVTIVKFKPTADVVEVVHGEWISKDWITESKSGRVIHFSTYKCSVCGKWNGRHKQPYCPHCGAKMDGERKKNDKE